MGLMDKLKSAKNFVTGGGAKVQLVVGPGALGQPISVTVRAQVAGAPLNVTKVYVLVRGHERVKLTVRDRDDPGDRDRVDEGWESFRQEFPLTGPLELAAESEHEWVGEITIPPTCQPSYEGRNATHTWQFQAGLDVRGNDPDSGWVDVHLR